MPDYELSPTYINNKFLIPVITSTEAKEDGGEEEEVCYSAACLIPRQDTSPALVTDFSNFWPYSGEDLNSFCYKCYNIFYFILLNFTVQTSSHFQFYY